MSILITNFLELEHNRTLLFIEFYYINLSIVLMKQIQVKQLYFANFGFLQLLNLIYVNRRII